MAHGLRLFLPLLHSHFIVELRENRRPPDITFDSRIGRPLDELLSPYES